LTLKIYDAGNRAFHMAAIAHNFIEDDTGKGARFNRALLYEQGRPQWLATWVGDGGG